MTIIISAWQVEDKIETALGSLSCQSYENLEVLVVDDCSADGTADIVSDYARDDHRVKLLRTDRNAGTYACRNLALTQARGKFVTTHDADDWSHPQKIETQVHDLIATDKLYNRGSWVRVTPSMHFAANNKYQASLVNPCYSSTMFRREVFDRFGVWDNIRIAADAELVRRVGFKTGLREAMEILPSCPMTIGDIDESSLTLDASTHISTTRFGVRREYRSAADYWHKTNLAHGEWPPVAADMEPFFPVPAFITSSKKQPPNPDILLIADFGTQDASSPTLSLLRSLSESRSKSLAVFHYPDYANQYEPSVGDQVRGVLWDRGIRIVVSGEQIIAKQLVVPNVSLLQHPLDQAPALRFEVLNVVCEQRADCITSLQDKVSWPTVGEDVAVNTFATMGQMSAALLASQPG
ncbi:MAG: glycosyltransferase family A protein [Pseudomonadota bacterium]